MIRAIFQMEKKKIATSICIFLFITVAIRFLAMLCRSTPTGMDSGPCFSNANGEETANCNREETRSQ